MSDPGLYIVATPIGNLEDISYRAVRILGEVDRIAAEDTRHTARLLKHYGIATPLLALHEHNEERVLPGLMDALQAGQSVALVSDAGTPLISDPGYRLVREAHGRGCRVYTVPGASAITAALSIAGLATDRFLFEGFLPARSAARRARLDALRSESATLVFFEASHRILASLQDMQSALGPDREISVCRELTKQFEKVLKGDFATVIQRMQADADQCRGEFVVIVQGNPGMDAPDLQAALRLAAALQEYLGASQAARVAARLCQVSRRELYARMNDEKSSPGQLSGGDALDE